MLFLRTLKHTLLVVQNQMKLVILLLTLLLSSIFGSANYIDYERHSHPLAHEQSSSHLLFDFSAGSVVMFQNNLVTHSGAQSDLKFFLIPLEQNQCGDRRIKFDAPFSYRIRQSGQYLLIIANRGPSPVMEGTLDVTIDDVVENLRVFVPTQSRSLTDSLYFFRPLQIPQLSTTIEFTLPNSPQNLVIQSIIFTTATNQYTFQTSQTGFISRDIIPGGTEGVLTVFYTLDEQNLGDLLSYQIRIDQNLVCLDGIWNYQERTCECFEGRVWSDVLERCSFCGNAVVDQGQSCDVALQENCPQECICPQNQVFNSFYRTCSLCGNGNVQQEQSCDFVLDQNCPASCQCQEEHVWNANLNVCSKCGNGVFQSEEQSCEFSIHENCNEICLCPQSYVLNIAMNGCYTCGNGALDLGNQHCDTAIHQNCPHNCQCPQNQGWNIPLQVCSLCGNGIVDNGEECDVSAISSCPETCLCGENLYWDNTANQCLPNFCNNYHQECQTLDNSILQQILQQATTQDQIRSLITLTNPLEDFSSGDISTDVFRRLFQAAQCMDFFYDQSIGEAYHTLLNQYTVQEANKQLYIRMLETQNGNPFYYDPNTVAEQVCAFQTNDQSSIPADLCSQRTSAGLYFSPHIHSPEAISNILRTIVDYGANNEAAKLDFGISYVSPNFQQNFLINIVSNYVSQSGVPRIQVLKYMIATLSDNMHNIQSASLQQYKEFAKYLYKKIYERMTNIANNYNYNPTLSLIAQQINEGKKVVIFAHSAGAQLANYIYTKLTTAQKSSVSLVFLGAANPPLDSSSYILNSQDFIVNYIRSQFGYNQVSHTYQSTFGDLNHEALGYLSSSTTLTQLLINAKNNAVTPDRIYGSGPITVQVTWDTATDVDTHVYEPGNVHVFYGNRNGVVGYLDVDDTNGYGPEHYYTSCEGILPGTYLVKVRQYSGSGSETTVKVYAGNDFYSIDVNLSSSARQKEVCNIIVTSTSIPGVFRYQIQPI